MPLAAAFEKSWYVREIELAGELLDQWRCEGLRRHGCEAFRGDRRVGQSPAVGELVGVGLVEREIVEEGGVDGVAALDRGEWRRDLYRFVVPP
jgi:hypothetical protein